MTAPGTSSVPLPHQGWYRQIMDGTYQVTMGNRGRLVIPAEVRARAGLTEGTSLELIETPGGVLLINQEQLKSLVRADLAGIDLVGELLAERRHQASTEDAS
jgi:AbrB family looped-hinge helix DNA binding protein